MAKWKKHREGGSWPGGKMVPDCNATERNNITNAYNTFIGSACLNCFPGLKSYLKAKWGEITIDCTDSDCNGSLSGRRSGDDILICDTNPPRVGAVLLHEMVHAVGGEELDSEAVERACYNFNGATDPCCGDWRKFRDETSAFQGNEIERKGKFVIWNSDTGEVWGLRKDGTRGPLCFQSNDWIHTYPDDGGWP